MNILGFVSITHDVLPPAYFCMLAQITGRFCITSVKIMTDHAAVPFPHATGRRTLENMYTVVIDVCDGSTRLEEGIHRQVPVL
jgi:hypothetical protein